MSRLLLAAPALPAAAMARVQTQEPPKPSAFAACVAGSETTLSPDERARVEKGIAGLEQSLTVIRNFTLPPGTDPALRFAPIASRRRR